MFSSLDRLDVLGFGVLATFAVSMVVGEYSEGKGRRSGIEESRQEAFRHGCGRYIMDPGTGDKRWEWLKPTSASCSK